MPVTVDVNHLQYQQDREGLLFRKIAEQGHYAGRSKPSNTRQGLYIATISGTLIASANTTHAIEVMRLMQTGLNGWNRGAKNSKGPFKSDAKTDQKYNVTAPQGGLILRQTIRDLPRPHQPHHNSGQYNHDHVWLTANEVKALTPTKVEPGSTYKIPEKIVRRLVRWHFIDHVRGSSSSWEYSHIKDASMVAMVTQVRGDGSEPLRVRIKIKGKAKCVCPPTGEVNPFTNDKVTTERGLDAEIRGWLTYDTKAKTFTGFELLAFGERWGTSIYNSRHKDLERSPIGFAFEFVDDSAGRTAKPAFAVGDYFSYSK